MFGYVTVNRDRLTPAEWERYSGFYCGLCRTLRSRFGLGGGLTLSNDSTFLLILLSSLYEPHETNETHRCPIHPMKARACVQAGEASEYVADMNLALAYHTCEDHWRDDRKLPAAAEMRLIREGYERVKKLRPEKCAALKRSLDALAELENARCGDADLAAARMGELLGDVFVWKPDDPWAEGLRAVGDGLGRFIYLMDACEDLASDRRKGHYNPLSALGAKAEDSAFLRGILSTAIARCTDAFERLPLEQDLGILRNILYSGVWSRYAQMTAKGAKASGGKEKDTKA